MKTQFLITLILFGVSQSAYAESWFCKAYAGCHVGGVEYVSSYGTGIGSTRKEAEQAAEVDALSGCEPLCDKYYPEGSCSVSPGDFCVSSEMQIRN